MRWIMPAALTASLLLAACGSPTAPQSRSPDFQIGTVGSAFRIITAGRVSSVTVNPQTLASTTIHDGYITVLCLEPGSGSIIYRYPSGTLVGEPLVCNAHSQGAGG